MTKEARTPAQSSQREAEAQLKAFIAKFEPAMQTRIRAARKSLRARFPTAYEMVYDNYNFFVIGYGPSLRPSEAILSLVADANGVGICLIQGARLPDPKKIMRGAGKQTRSFPLETTAFLSHPDVEKIFGAAVAYSKVPFQASGRGPLVIRSVSAKQRPRQKAVK